MTIELNSYDVDETLEMLNGEAVYDMAGRKVQSSMVNVQLRKGIYIINGKKYILK